MDVKELNREWSKAYKTAMEHIARVSNAKVEANKALSKIEEQPNVANLAKYMDAKGLYEYEMGLLKEAVAARDAASSAYLAAVEASRDVE